MADPWPSTLPQVFEEDGYSESMVDNVIRSQPDAGAPVFRRRFTAAPIMVTGSLTLTSAQRDTLEGFYRTHTAVRFVWANPRGGTRYYLFAGPPRFSAKTPYYKAAVSLIEFLTETGAG